MHEHIGEIDQWYQWPFNNILKAAFLPKKCTNPKTKFKVIDGNPLVKSW
jgi:hypothetical protein